MRRPSRIVVDVVINSVFGAVKVAALLLVIRLGAQMFTTDAFGLFLLTRRIAFTAASLLQLGISQTLLREIPMRGEDPELKRRWIVFSVAFWIGAGALLFVAFLAAQTWLTRLMFARSDAPTIEVGLWTVILIVSAILHFIAAAYLLAERKIVQANVLELLDVSGFLLIGFLYARGDDVAAILQVQSLGIIAACILALSIKLRSVDRTLFVGWMDLGGVFVRYGFPRSFVPFLDMAVLLIGPWLIRDRLSEAGYLVVALTLAQLIQVFIVPITQVTSVVCARLIGAGDEERLTHGIRMLFGTATYVTLLVVAATLPWAAFLIREWLGDPAIAGAVHYDVLFLAAGLYPLAIFHALKGVVDVRWVRPLNVLGLVATAVVQIVTYAIARQFVGELDAILIGIVTSFWVLGGMTAFWVRGYLPVQGYWGFGRLIVVTAAVLAVNVFAANELNFFRFFAVVIASGALATGALLHRPASFVASVVELFGLSRRTA